MYSTTKHLLLFSTLDISRSLSLNLLQILSSCPFLPSQPSRSTLRISTNISANRCNKLTSCLTLSIKLHILLGSSFSLSISLHQSQLSIDYTICPVARAQLALKTSYWSLCAVRHDFLEKETLMKFCHRRESGIKTLLSVCYLIVRRVYTDIHLLLL